MKKLFAAVAIAAFALTSAVPAVQAAERSTGLTKVENATLHQVATKKKTSTKKPAKKKVSKAGSSTKKTA
jgi:hypothetical protein